MDEQGCWALACRFDQIGFGTAGTGICKGDSGGPSFIKNTKGEMQIIGINSYVVGPDADICSKNSFQTLAHSYKAWIDSKLSAINKNKK